MGMSCDQTRQYLKAISLYQKYLKACEETQDTLGIALACNHLGISHFYVGEKEDVQLSLEYHKRHAEISKDTLGQFVSNMNLGIVLLILEDFENATAHLRVSYGCALFMEDMDAQSVSYVQVFKYHPTF